MNKIKIKCLASPETNDHQACIYIDGEDWLGRSHMGIDPPAFFRQKTLLNGGEAWVGRCHCGCAGCDDVVVDIVIDPNEVQWKSPQGYMFRFDRLEYESEIRAVRNDHSWEDNNRTAERLVDSVFYSVVLPDGWKYDWASARWNRGKITLSFMKGSQQKLMEFDWDPENPTTAENQARIFIEEMFNQ
jgi:hypothetical protein